MRWGEGSVLPLMGVFSHSIIPRVQWGSFLSQSNLLFNLSPLLLHRAALGFENGWWWSFGGDDSPNSSRSGTIRIYDFIFICRSANIVVHVMKTSYLLGSSSCTWKTRSPLIGSIIIFLDLMLCTFINKSILPCWPKKMVFN